MIDNVPDSMVASDREGRTIVGNMALARTLQVSSPDELIGKTDFDLFPQSQAERFLAEDKVIMRTGEPLLNKEETIETSGHKLWLSVNRAPLRDRQGQIVGIVAVGRDITERKRAEHALQRYTERLEVLHEIDRGILAARSPQAMTEIALHHIQKLIPSRWAGVAIFDHEENQAIVLTVDESDRGRLVETSQVSIDNSGIDKQLWQGEINLVTDLSTQQPPAPVAQILPDDGFKSLVNAPLLVKHELIGMLNLAADHIAYFTKAHVEIASQIATQLAIAIQQTQLQEEVQQYAEGLEQRVADRVRELSVLYEVTKVLSDALDMSSTLTRLLERMLGAVDCYEGAIHLLTEPENELQLAVHQGFPANLVERITTVSVDSVVLGRVIRDGEPVYLPDISGDSIAQIPYDPGQKSYVGVPMRARGRPVGVLSVLRDLDVPDFSPEEKALLTSIADQAGVVVESARLRQLSEEAAVMEERARLARDLHDSVTQLLYSINLFTEVGRESYRLGDLAELDNALIELGDVSQQALKEMRLLVYELRPPALDQDGLVGALRHRLETVEGRVGIETRLLVEDDAYGLPRDVEDGLYHIAQEALNNAVKHAVATVITVLIELDDTGVRLEITDNGAGFDPAKIDGHGGLGLTSMRERAENLGGTMTVRSAPDQGTTVKVRLTFDENGRIAP
jgi:PAS domain S-box-containing protein